MEFGFKKKYTSLDSCTILRTILGDNPEQERQARALILSGRNFYIDDVAIMECIYVLTKKSFKRPEITDFIQTFLSNPMVHYNKTFFDPIFKDYVAHPSLSFDDLVLAARIEEKGYAPLFTFDQKFARQSKTATLIK